MEKRWFCAVVAALALTVSVAAAGEFTFVEEPADTRPAIWKEAPSQTVLLAELAARTDAWAKLAEFIGGMAVKGSVSVRQLVDVNTITTGSMHSRIAGMSTEKVVHYPSGMVQVAVSAKISDLVKSIGESLAGTVLNGVSVDPSTFRNVNGGEDEGTITMWGNSALKGSKGEGIVQAVRAAELLAMEQMMAELQGIQIDRETTVRDLALASDGIQTCLNDSIKGIQYVDYRIRDQADIVEVDAAMHFARTIQRVMYEYQDVYTVDCRTGCLVLERQLVEKCIQDQEEVTHRVTAKSAIASRSAAVPAS